MVIDKLAGGNVQKAENEGCVMHNVRIFLLLRFEGRVDIIAQ